MAKKKILTVVKIQIEAGKASPAPPVGTALGPHGIAIMDFVKAYNAQTEAQAGTVIPTEITIYEDRTFDFVLKTPPTAVLVREKAGLAKAANKPIDRAVVRAVNDLLGIQVSRRAVKAVARKAEAIRTGKPIDGHHDHATDPDHDHASDPDHDHAGTF